MLTLLLFPGSDLPNTGPEGLDKLIHLGMFYLFSSLWMRAYPRRKRYVLGLGLALAVGSEILQGLLPLHRSAEGLDLLADVIGLLLGAYMPFFSLFSPRYGKKSSPD